MGTSTSAASIATQANGWSIEGNVGLGLDTMQAGGIINVTAAEECSFALGSATAGYFCYDGVCGELAASPDDTGVQGAMNSVVDDNGDKILTTTTTGTTTVKVVMPVGKSCDGLEYRIDGAVTVQKSVVKNNNGRSFKITRSFLQTSTIPGTDILTATSDGPTFPIHRTVSTVSHASGVQTLTIGQIAADTPSSIASANCGLRLARHVITLDAMPDSSATTVTKTLKYTSPVGSCSVAETTKGTYESYECSNRGACDGKSGLCTCYEG